MLFRSRHNGIDDGGTVRELTPANTHPFVSGAAHPPVFSGGPAGKTEAVRGY